MTNEHGLEYECDETAQALRLWKAVQDGKVFICERRVHLPERDGGTGYEYYVPIAAPAWEVA